MTKKLINVMFWGENFWVEKPSKIIIKQILNGNYVIYYINWRMNLWLLSASEINWNSKSLYEQFAIFFVYVLEELIINL